MQILIPDSWLREYLETDATPRDIQKALSLCGPSIERLHESEGDFIYDIEITTNRVDCMSVYGIAREAAAILPHFGHTAKLLSDPFETKLSFKTSPTVDYLKAVVDPALCPRFSAILVCDVKLGPSPDWVVKKLESVGMRSLNNVVDVSNLLMHDLGQPVHTFDYDKIHGHTMNLRESKSGESVTTLDGKKHTLPGHDIIIEDGSKKLIDLCGIMGGLDSAVDNKTKNVLLFVQTYEPVHIRKTSMSLSHRTQAAVLFEKGLYVESVLPTMEKALQLFKELTGGIPEKVALDIYSEQPRTEKVSLSESLISSHLGITLSLSEIAGILFSLGFHKNYVPWWRKNDIQIPEDLVEEVARIYGYHNLPSQLMTGSLPTNRPNDLEFYWVGKIKQALKYWGFTEAYTYSLVENDPNGLKLKNPLSSEWTYLRTNLTDSHKKIITENRGRVSELNFFEIANVYIPQKSGLPEENLHLTLSTTSTDIFKFKGIIASILQDLLGLINFDINITTHSSVLTYETNLSELLPKATSIKKYAPISPYQSVIEDLNVNLSTSYDELIKKIYKTSSLIKQIDLIDRYENRLTLRITYHDEKRQLSKDDIAPIRAKLEVLVD